MVNLSTILNRLNPVRILVAGDMLLDSYTIGKVRRISPEAPVAIVHVQEEDHRPGGAGNVILNLLSLGAEVTAVGRVGGDWAGSVLLEALQKEGLDTSSILEQKGYFTPVKNRIIADNQQIVRVDREQIIPLDPSLEEVLALKFEQLLEEIDLVAISDYGKGFLTPNLLSSLIHLAKKRGIPVITDPKGQDFRKYKGTTIIKPNLAEAFASANLPTHAPLENAAAAVLSQCEADLLMVTRSEAGISLFTSCGTRSDFPVHAKEVKDVTGAGDTVLAMLSHAVANGLSYQEAAQLCNIAAGLAIEHVGCARISLSDLALRLFEHNMRCKVFDQEHLFVLKELLKQKPYRLLTVSGVKTLTPSLYHSIKKASYENDSLLVYLKDAEPTESLVEMLSSLQEVNYIALRLDDMELLAKAFPPKGRVMIE